MAQKPHVVAQAHDVQLRQSPVELGQRGRARGRMHDELGDHRVVKRADGVTLAHTAVDAHRPRGEQLRGRRAVHRQGAGGGQKVAVGVFGANARFDGMALDVHLVLRQGQGLATGDAQLPLHQVQAGDGLGDRVLNLQAGVHLHEEEVHAALALLNDELHRARPHIAHGLGGGHRRLAHALAQLCGHARRGGFFQHLLVTALHRAIALEQMNAMPLPVGKHLHLDVARALHILFNQHRRVAKTVLRLALARGQGTGKVVGAAHHAHALAATACAGFDQHRVTDFFGLAGQ